MGESGTVIGENGRIEPFCPSEVDTSTKVSSQTTSSWRLNIKEFCLPQQNVDDDDHHHSTFPQLFRASMPSLLHSHRLVFLLLSNKLFLT